MVDVINFEESLQVEHKDTKLIYLAAETEEEMWEWLEQLTKAAAVSDPT